MSYEVVEPDAMMDTLTTTAQINMAALVPGMTLRRIESELQSEISRLESMDNELSHAIDLINNKLNALMAVLPQAASLDMGMGERTVCHCSLSASGIAFTHRGELPVDAVLRLRLVILPDYNHIFAHGRVARCSPLTLPDGDFTHIVGVEFLDIHERYRRLLAERNEQRADADRHATLVAGEEEPVAD